MSKLEDQVNNGLPPFPSDLPHFCYLSRYPYIVSRVHTVTEQWVASIMDMPVCMYIHTYVYVHEHMPGTSLPHDALRALGRYN